MCIHNWLLPAGVLKTDSIGNLTSKVKKNKNKKKQKQKTLTSNTAFKNSDATFMTIKTTTT